MQFGSQVFDFLVCSGRIPQACGLACWFRLFVERGEINLIILAKALDEAVTAFGAARVREYDTTRASPAGTARKIAADFRTGVRSSEPLIDWTLGYDSTRLRSLLSAGRFEPAST